MKAAAPIITHGAAALLYFPLSVLLLFLSGYIKSFLSTSILHCFLKNAMASCHPFLFRPAIRSR